MRFRITGTLIGDRVFAQWEDGRLDASPLLLEIAQVSVDTRQVVCLTPTGPCYQASLMIWEPAFATLVNALDSLDTAVGDIPVAGSGPPGTVY